MNHKVCFLGGARYSDPLESTAEKKFRAIYSLGNIFVIGFSTTLRPRIFTEHARFYLLPQLRLPVLRYLEMFLFGQLVTVWLVFYHGVRIIVAQSPYEGFVAALVVKFISWFGCKVVVIVENHGDFEESLFMQR